MKRFVVVGLGNFGFATAEALAKSGYDVIAVDTDGEQVDRIAPIIARAAVGDGTDIDILERLGARDADAGIISTGDDITASILATMALGDLKVRELFVKVISIDHARVMNRIGVTETIFPERDSAVGLAARISGRAVLNYFKLGGGMSLQEMGVPMAWTGKTIRELELRKHFDITIVAVHDILTDQMTATPDPDRKLRSSDTLLVAGADEALSRMAKVQ